mgnify:FL=1
MKKVKVFKILKLIFASCLVILSSILPEIVGFHPFFVNPYYGILLFVGGCSLFIKEGIISKNNKMVEAFRAPTKQKKHKKQFKFKKKHNRKNK